MPLYSHQDCETEDRETDSLTFIQTTARKEGTSLKQKDRLRCLKSKNQRNKKKERRVWLSGTHKKTDGAEKSQRFVRYYRAHHVLILSGGSRLPGVDERVPPQTSQSSHQHIFLGVLRVGDSGLDGFFMFVFLPKVELVMNESTLNVFPVILQPVSGVQ